MQHGGVVKASVHAGRLGANKTIRALGSTASAFTTPLDALMQ